MLGAGAMGCLFSQQLISAGCSVTLLLRNSPDTAAGNIRIDTHNSSRQLPVKLDAATGQEPLDKLLICTKAPDVHSAMRSVLHRITPATPVVLAANGMGFAQAVLELLPSNPVYCCTTTEGAYRLGTRHIRHAGRGITRLGSLRNEQAPGWFADWAAPPLSCVWESDINAAMWHKLAINCAINPLTALHRCHNGELGRDPVLRSQVNTLCDEIAAVSHACGYTETAVTVHSAVAAVIADTAENRSSMLQDVEAGRTTEIDFITGFLVREAERLNVNTPANRALLEEVTQIDH